MSPVVEGAVHTPHPLFCFPLESQEATATGPSGVGEMDFAQVLPPFLLGLLLHA